MSQFKWCHSDKDSTNRMSRKRRLHEVLSIIDDNKSNISDKHYLALCQHLKRFHEEVESHLYEVHYFLGTICVDFVSWSTSSLEPKIIFEKRLCKLTDEQKSRLQQHMHAKDPFDANIRTHGDFLEKAGLPKIETECITMPVNSPAKCLDVKEWSPKLYITKIKKV